MNSLLLAKASWRLLQKNGPWGKILKEFNSKGDVGCLFRRDKFSASSSSLRGTIEGINIGKYGLKWRLGKTIVHFWHNV